ncbi:MAG: hypothetical protein J5878_05905 [Oscillospiraceae bacterium]|nr:hypothetical protein [Oscillospiraceae bacterium]MBO4418969.1 hypothetical protein [Oscillospiraceae bacterium]
MASFTNQATLTYNGQQVNSNVVTGEITSTLTLTKTPVGAIYGPGDSITFVVSLVNSGSAAVTNQTLTDDLGGYEIGGGQTVYPLAYVAGSVQYYVNGTLQPAPAVTAGPPLTVTGLSIPAGGNALLIYEAELTAAAPLAVGSQITNTVSVNGAGRAEPLTAQATVTVETGPELTIIKSLSPATVGENGQLTYTFLIQNMGNEPAGVDAAIAVSDLFNPILSNLTATLNGQPLTLASDYSYNQSTGQFNTVPGRITVPAAVYAQDTATGNWTVTPGEATLTVTGTV